MENRFWKNKRVLITGYEGFLGSWLTKTLLTFQAKVTGIDIVTGRKKTVLSKAELAKVNIIKGSVENLSLLRQTIAENKPEFIFHLAAKSLVGDCLKNPLKGFSVNIKGTWNVLAAARESFYPKGIIIASSDKAYGSHKNLPYKEDFSLSGNHPYDVSKSCADLLANTYFHTYGLPVSVTRCGNIFGPGDFNFSRLVPDCIRSALNDKPFLIRSNGKFLRDYIYVKDVVGAYLTLAEKITRKEIKGEPFNFSDENPLSVLQLSRQIYRILGQEPNYKILDQAEYEIKKQYLSAAKARRLLKWKAKYSLDQGLKETIAWYKGFLRR